MKRVSRCTEEDSRWCSPVSPRASESHRIKATFHGEVSGLRGEKMQQGVEDSSLQQFTVESADLALVEGNVCDGYRVVT